MGDNSFALSFSSLLVVLLLAAKASSSHSSNISASAATAAFFLPCNHSRGLTGSCLIADNLGLEYLIDSPHFPTRILAGARSVTAGTSDRNNPAGCGRTSKGTPYGPCTPGQNPRPPNCGTYNRACDSR